jgi:D-glycero-D-manno-heptose 1,7-bisphosphate phosphatase
VVWGRFRSSQAISPESTPPEYRTQAGYSERLHRSSVLSTARARRSSEELLAAWDTVPPRPKHRTSRIVMPRSPSPSPMNAAPTGPPADGGLRRAVFVDRDGTLDPDLHYLRDAERLELFRGVGQALQLVHAHGQLVVCVTNQSGVERGYYTTEDVERIHSRVNDFLAAEGTRVDAFYYCPHAPEHGCDCRKPGTGLFVRAAAELGLDLPGSAMVGDRATDIEPGRRLGMLTALVRSRGHEAEVDAELAAHGVVPDIRSDTFLGAVLRILARG